MRPSLIATTLWAWSHYAWARASASASAHTFPLVQRDIPAVIGMNLHSLQSLKPHLKARDSATVEGQMADVPDRPNVYLNVSIGTPPQPLAISLSIQGSGITVLAEDAESRGNVQCQDVRYCSGYGFYNSSKSSTNGTVYIPDNYIGWDKPTDIMTIGETQVKNVPLSLVEIAHDSYSHMGIGPRNTSLPYILVDRGLIRSPSFSIWNNVSRSGQGAKAGVLFGGVNKAKYHGPLQAYPSVKADYRITIPLSGLSVQTDSNDSTSYSFGSARPFELDNTLALTKLPNDTVQALYKDLDISWRGYGDGQYGVLDCSRQYTENRTISLSFRNTTISVPWGDFFTPYGSKSEPGLCNFDIWPVDPEAESPSYAGRLGYGFTQHMYIAVDYNNNFIGVAPLNENPGPDQILEIGDGPKIPDAVGDFPSSIVPYSPVTTTATRPSTSTSTGLAAVQTIPSYRSGGVFAGVAGAALLVAL